MTEHGWLLHSVGFTSYKVVAGPACSRILLQNGLLCDNKHTLDYMLDIDVGLSCVRLPHNQGMLVILGELAGMGDEELPQLLTL